MNRSWAFAQESRGRSRLCGHTLSCVMVLMSYGMVMGCSTTDVWRAPYELNPDEYVMCSGRRWDIRTGDAIQGAGPNYWGGLGEHVTQHGDRVRLRIMPDVHGTWRSSEISTPLPPGTTRVSVTFGNLPEHLDPRVVLGVFVYRDDQSEFDFEMSAWGEAGAAPLQFVMVPAHVPGHRTRFEPISPSLASTWTQVFEWGPRTVRFTLYQDDVKVSSWLYKGLDVPRYARHRLHINLWLLHGTAPMNEAPIQVDVLSVKIAHSG